MKWSERSCKQYTTFNEGGLFYSLRERSFKQSKRKIKRKKWNEENEEKMLERKKKKKSNWSLIGIIVLVRSGHLYQFVSHPNQVIRFRRDKFYVEKIRFFFCFLWTAVIIPPYVQITTTSSFKWLFLLLIYTVSPFIHWSQDDNRL